MEKALDGEQVSLIEPTAAATRAGPARPPSFFTAAAAAVAAGALRAPPQDLRDEVQQIANEYEIVFAPRSGVSSQGKQLYTFGSSTLFMDRGVVFVRTAGQSSFEPISNKELSEMARSMSRGAQEREG